MNNVRERLQDVFQNVFDTPAVLLRDDMSAKDFEDWDSLQHINLIVAVEKAFGIRFATGEIARLKQPGQNIGSFIQCIESKLNA